MHKRNGPKRTLTHFNNIIGELIYKTMDQNVVV